jgi:hypothetical protein
MIPQSVLRFAAVLALCTAGQDALAQDTPPPLAGSVTSERTALWYAGGAEAGTHKIGLGADVVGRHRARRWGDAGGGRDLEFTANAGARYSARALGIPGESVGADAGLGVAVSIGGERLVSDVYLGREHRRAHTLTYAFLGYLSTDGTSQLSGVIGYESAHRNGAVFALEFENDFLAFQRRDRFRTFALRTRYHRSGGGGVVGIGGSLILWTGTTEGLGYLNRGDTYDLSNQYGGSHSHGILALDLYRGPLRLSVGVDAESVRTAVQNNFHNLIDDGAIPALDRNARVYLNLSFNDLGPLY